MVGPVLAEDAKLLPSALSTFLESGQTEGLGAIFVSMGTLARLSHEEACSMAHALSALPNPVLWKLDPLHLRGERLVCSTRSTALQSSAHMHVACNSGRKPSIPVLILRNWEGCNPN